MLYNLDLDSILVDNKIILITGGTGSFGKKLLDILLNNYNPKKIIIFSRDEFKQYNLQKIYPLSKYPNIRYFIGDIRDYTRLNEAFKNVNIVFHGAALKHVPIIEYNPMEAIKTNILGTDNIIKAAIANNVDNVIAISTDKCVNPVNLYGATKLCLEKLIIHANILSDHTKFIVVRYGNVFGSRGSVVNIFNNIIRDDKPFTITDERMTRFTMTLDEAVHFVLKCYSVGCGGEIFVPILPSYNIVQLAKIMDNDRDIKIIGIRPGEKIHELMISRDESHNVYKFDDFYMITSLRDHDIYKYDMEQYGLNYEKCGEFKYSSGKNDMIENSRLKELLNDHLLE